MSIKYHFTDDTDSAIRRLRSLLEANNFDVDTRMVAWSILRFRRDTRDWTNVYSGLTAKARLPRSWFKVVGPEELSLEDILKEQSHATSLG